MTNIIDNAIRTRCLQMRRSISREYQQTCSQAVCNTIRSIQEYRDAKHIAIYKAVQGEIDLDDIWKTVINNDKNYYFPVISSKDSLQFTLATVETNFQKNRFGILEPEPTHETISPEQLDIIFAPLVAFDIQGNRIGMGQGYYDKTLSTLRPKLLLGLGYEFQKQSSIKKQPWDVQLDGIITEETIYWTRV